MTRSIFDPTGGEAERSGSRFTPQAADNLSHMPPDVTDGEVGGREAEELRALADAAAPSSDPAQDGAAASPQREGNEDEYDH